MEKKESKFYTIIRSSAIVIVSFLITVLTVTKVFNLDKVVRDYKTKLGKDSTEKHNIEDKKNKKVTEKITTSENADKGISVSEEEDLQTIIDREKAYKNSPAYLKERNEWLEFQVMMNDPVRREEYRRKHGFQTTEEIKAAKEGNGKLPE